MVPYPHLEPLTHGFTEKGEADSVLDGAVSLHQNQSAPVKQWWDIQMRSVNNAKFFLNFITLKFLF